MRGSARVALAALAAVAAGIAGCGAEPESQAIVGSIVEELAAQRYGVASARYRAYEDTVLSPEAAPAWRRALAHDDATVREWAVDALWRIGRPEDVADLVEALDDPFRKVGEAAVRGLIELDPGTARAALLERLADPDAERVMLAVRGLGDLGDTGVIPALVERLDDASLPDGVRSAIAQALGRLGDESAADALVRTALDPDLGLQLRRLAAESLVALSGPRVDDAIRALRAADDPYIVALAEGVLDG